MGVQTAAGTIISICAVQPPTFDQAGYESTDLVFSPIGEIVDGGTHGRKYAKVEHKPLGSRGVRKFKGSFDEGTKTLQLGLDRNDAGQIIADQAKNSDEDYSFKVEYPNGDIDYFQAKVMSFEKGTTGVDTVVSGTIVLELTTTAAGEGIVEVTAP